MHTEFEAAAGMDGAPDFVHRPSVLGRRHMISSVHYHATMGGLRILEQGGNAIDAGVAAGICLNVVEPQSAMFGGVAPIVVFLANGADDESGSTTAGSGRSRVFTVSGLGRWPQAASLDDYLARYGGDLPGGVPRTVTPGCSRCLAHGTGAVRHAQSGRGAPASPGVDAGGLSHVAGVARIHRQRRATGLSLDPMAIIGSRVAARRPGTGGWRDFPPARPRRDVPAPHQRRGPRQRRPGDADHGRPAISSTGASLPQQIVSFYQEEGSILTTQDLAEFAVKVEPPAHTTYRGYDVYSCGPWCQGPTLLQSLNLLEGFDLRAMGRGSAAYLHTVAEALDLAFADRERYYGDPDLIDVPLAGLLSKDYAAARRELIREDRTWGEMPPAGDPWSYQNGHGSNAAAGTAAAPGPPRAGGRYGLRLRRGRGRQYFLGHALRRHLRHPRLSPGWGFAVSSRGTQTWLDPQHASRLQPWKRPRLTPNPAFGATRRPQLHALWLSGWRSASAGDVAGVPQRRGVRP